MTVSAPLVWMAALIVCSTVMLLATMIAPPASKLNLSPEARTPSVYGVATAPSN